LEHLVRAEAEDPRSGVELVGALDAPGVADLLRSAAVFTTAPRPTWKWTEQLGLAYLEALASGLPIVTTRCGTNDEAVHPPNHLPDRGRRAEVGAANRRHVVTHHDLGTQCVAMGQAFTEVEAFHRSR